jgi:signal transduction histidine kinase
MGLFQKKTTKNADAAVLSELALKSISDGVVIIGYDGIVQLVNPSGLKLLGVANASDVMGLNYLSVVKLMNKEGKIVVEEDNPITKILSNNRPVETRSFSLVPMRDSKPIPVSLIAVPSGGPGASRVVVIRDITRELEEEREKTEFVSTASHEMRTPVASIEGYLGLALNPQTATLDDRARQYLMQAHASSKHLGRLFQELLDSTKLEDQQVLIRPVPVEMTSFVKSIVDGQAPSMMAKSLQCQFGTGIKNKQSTEKSVAQLVYSNVDVDFLRESLDNIIENAVKYTPSGGTVTIGVRGELDRVIINVTDTGIGISTKDIEHIFQKFYRADTSDTQTIGGTGLGLFIVRRRIEAMGGKVWVESDVGQGSTFYVSLPRISADEYEKLKLVMENNRAAGTGEAPVITSYASTIIQIEDNQVVEPVEKQTIESIVNSADGKTLAGNLSQDQLDQLKQQFAANIQETEFKKNLN